MKFIHLTRRTVVLYFCAAQYEMTGASRRYGTSCSYDFFSNRITKAGVFFSPLYPRNYPLSSRCLYAFHALEGEVVQLRFNRIRLDTTSEHRRVLLVQWMINHSKLIITYSTTWRTLAAQCLKCACNVGPICNLTSNSC